VLPWSYALRATRKQKEACGMPYVDALSLQSYELRTCRCRTVKACLTICRENQPLVLQIASGFKTEVSVSNRDGIAL
jgi:hypothetical protein